MKQKTLKRNQVAKILGVSGQTVDKYRKQGYLTPMQYVEGGMHRYDPDEVRALMEGRKK